MASAVLTLLSIFFGAAFTLATAFALGLILLRKTPAPPEIVLGAGAAVESLLVFLLLLGNLAHWGVFLAIGAAAMVAARCWHGPLLKDPVSVPRVAWIVFAAYGAWYFVNALAPETLADGITYHLGLPAEYLRLHGFPDSVTFYGMLPQGMEMLYTVAFAFGRHSAAKLVEFTFFLATIPLIFRVGRRLGASDLASTVAAVFYFCAPVVGLTGSSSYTDAAGVFFLMAALYLLLLREDRYLLLAGVLAGFCYAIKLPGLIVPAGAVLLLAAQRRWRAAMLVAAGAALVIAPWMVRDLAITGNPVAPMMSSVFTNPYFHAATDRELAADLRSLGGIAPAHVPWELAFGDHLTGTFGPLLFALPLGLLALNKREGRLLCAGVLVFVLPWLTNTGARFLMPAMMLAALALGMSLPRPLAWAAIGIQAVLCWPHVLGAWETRYSFRLHEFPIAAALRIESESAYCKRRFDEYNVAKMVEKATPPDSRILALMTVASAYLDRDVAVTWQSAETDRLLDTLRLASLYSTTPTFDWKASWPEQAMRTLRFRMPAAYDGEWDINEVRLFSGDDRVFNSPQWTLAGWPNRWEAPLAFDGNLATRWRTWETVRAGMYLDIELGNPQRLSSAVLVTHTPVFRVPLEVYGQDVKGRWHLLTRDPQAIPRPPQDLRLEAARALRASGFRYLLAPTGSGGNAAIGNVLVGHEAEWGLERVGDAGRFYLFHVR
uniref:Uncharacterized protein n=1 Tax=Solibacter usitatus (strain Ellin6076) TaxID=234267 RepID=Q01PU4_SOLUE